MTQVLIIEARFYDHLADMALRGVRKTLDDFGVSYKLVSVPGCLEIPATLNFLKDKYDAFVVLGCVIRGETTHYDLVCNESFRGIYDVVHEHGLALGNGIQTVENEAQAIARLDPDGPMNKGGAAAKAALRMLQIKEGVRHG